MLQRIRDLDISLLGPALWVRAPGRGFAARVNPIAIAVLAFCDAPRRREEVGAAFGPPGEQMYDGLASAGLLVPPDRALDTPVFFQNFASLDTHRRMLADRVRLDAYAAALREVVRPGDVVVDAGTGSGILAMLAAKAGARRVFAVDNAEILGPAREVVAANGLAGAVELVAGDFRSVELPERASVLVTETFGALAWAEGAAPDLRACLARNAPDATVIPARVELWFAPVDRATSAGVLAGFSAYDGIDFGPLRAASAHRAVTTEIPAGALVGEPVCLADRAWPGESDVFEGEGVLAAREPFAGLAAWFDVGLSPSVRLSTGPSAPMTHWKQVWLPLPELPAGEHAVKLRFQPPANDRRGFEVEGTVGGRPVFWRVR